MYPQTALLMLLGVLGASGSRASAVDRFWVGTSGGEWYDQQNWAVSLLDSPPASVPGIGDIARFEIGGRSYTVTLADVVDLKSVKVPSDFVTFDLQGRQLVTSQVVHVGTVLNDIGTLTLRNGNVSSPAVLVGFNLGDGRLFIENDAVLTVEGSLSGIGLPLSVGGLPTASQGLGLLEVLGALFVRDTDSVVGGRLGGEGTATVNGGSWTSDGSLVIGHDGAAGHVLIENGGSVFAGGLTFVGETGRTNEFVDVTGTGELDITNGTLTTAGTATIGSAANSFGDADLVGPNSVWNIGGFLFVAESGIGNLNIRNDADVTVQNDTLISVGSNEGLLNVTGFGSLVNDGSLYVGGSTSSSGGPGHLLVQDNGTVDIGALLKVWDTGTLTIEDGTITTGTLTIQPGATLDFQSGRLVINSGALNIPVNFEFGGTNPFNPPEISLVNGALATLTDFSLGRTAGTFSSFDINGSAMNVANDINIGGNASQSLGSGRFSLTGGLVNAGGVLRIWNGGELAALSGRATAAEVRLTGGTMTIEGLGSFLHVDASGDLPLGIPGIHVGFAPALSELTIEDGAGLTAPDIDFTVATDTSSLAFATVTGADSRLTVREAHVGNLGDGTLNVLNSANATFTGDLDIGFATNSFGSVFIDGAGSKAACEGTTTVGRQGLGSLHLTPGASFHSLGDTLIGALAAPVTPAPGFVIVDGGEWVSDQSVYLGGDEIGPQDGGGQVFLKTDGIIVNEGTMQVWSTGTLSLEGGNLRTRDLLFQTGSGLELLAGSITVDGGQFRLPSTSLVFGGAAPTDPVAFSFVNGADAQTTFAWHVGGAAGTHGATTVSGVSAGGQRSTLFGTGGGGGADLVVAREGTGNMQVLDGGLADFGADVIIAAQDNAVGRLDVGGESDGFRATVRATRGSNTAIMVGGKEGTTGGIGRLDVFDGGLVETSGDMTIARNLGSRGNVSLFSRTERPGEIRVGDDVFLGGNSAGFGGQGEILMSGGGLLIVNDVLKVWPDGFVDMDEGTIRVNHLDLTDTEPGSFNFFLGRIEANRISGNLENFSGTLAPGNSIAAMTVDGNYHQFTTARLEIEMNGPTPGIEHDVVNVTGTATLDGTVHVIVDPGFAPAVGQTFTIMTFPSRVGEFTAVTVDGAVEFNLVHNANSVQLVVSPPFLPGNLDGDADVDLDDHAILAACMTGPNVAVPPAGCTPGAFDLADLDNDGDVDLDDFALFMKAFTGPS